MVEPADEQVRDMLKQWDIDVPEEDIPFLRRAFLRQRDLLQRIETSTPTDSEPAHIFRPLS